MEVECIGNTQIIHMEETGITQRTIGLMCAVYLVLLLQILNFELIIVEPCLSTVDYPKTMKVFDTTNQTEALA